MSGIERFPNVSGIERFPHVSGIERFPNVPGIERFPNVSGIERFHRIPILYFLKSATNHLISWVTWVQCVPFLLI